MGSLGKPVDGPVSRLINRRISGVITRVILELGLPVTPNQVSLLSLILSILASLAAAMGSLQAAGILAQSSSIIDGVDGELARARGIASRAGGFLDTMIDRYSDIILYLGVGYYLIQQGAPQGQYAIPLMAVLLALSGDLMVSYLHARGEKDSGVHPSRIGPLDSIASRDVRILVVAASLLVERPLEGLILVAGLSHTYVAVKSAYVYLYLRAKP